jgi:hypothetical protein
MSSSKKLHDIVKCLLLAPLLKSKNTEDLSYVAAWLLSRSRKKRFRTTHVVAWLFRKFTVASAYGFYILQKYPSDQNMGFFENNLSDIDVCVSLSTFCIFPRITHNYNMSLLKDTNSRSHMFFFLPPSDFNLKRHLADAMALPPASPLLSYSKISWSSLYVCGCLLPSQKRKMAELMICVFFQNAVLAEI